MARPPVVRTLLCASVLLASFGLQAAPAKKEAAKPAKAAAAKPAAKAAAPAAAAIAVDQNVEVELSHELGEDKGEQLKKLVDKFNAESKGGKIVVSQRPWGQGTLPAMTIVSELDEDLYLDGKPRYKPLWQVMKDAGAPLETSSPARVMVPAPVDATNRMVALPVALSTPVLFYNKELLEKVGVTADAIPTTWRAWVGVLGKFYTQGVSCPITVSQPVSTLYENASTWNNQPMTQAGKSESFTGNGLIQVKHMAMMSSWRKSGYLHYFGRAHEAESHFASGECGVLVGPSGAYPTLVRNAKFTVAVASYPYHEDAYGAPAHTMADGPSLWVAANKSAAEYRLIARFVQFWLQPANQLEWQVDAGYLPLNRAGSLAVTGSELLKDDLAAIRQGMSQLSRRPATAATAPTAFAHRLGVRRILAEEMEQVFDDKKPPKQGLDDAVQRIRIAEDGCCRARVR